jgi:glycerophosphoryl diester phosphodiesterase
MSSYSMMQAPEGSRAPVFADTPALCGHRGSGRGVVGGLLENTLASHRAAVQAGLRWVEVDGRLTRDGVLVARHDPAAQDGRAVAELTAAEADRIGLMRIADLLADLPPEVSDLVAGESERRRILVSSFDPAAVTIVRERSPMVPAGLLTWGGFPLRKAIPAAVHLGVDVVAVHVTSFRLDETATRLEAREPSHSVRVAHEAGLQVVAWCPRPAEGDRLIAAGVDCLIVDDAVAAVAHYSR